VQNLDANAKHSVGIQSLDNFIEMGIDLISQVVKLTPRFAKVRRLVGVLQEFAVLPLDVVDDAPEVAASMQADSFPALAVCGPRVDIALPVFS
jgi:hypothetical protein